MHKMLLTEKHPELHHYTDKRGLEGIFESGTLYATRYDYLNDSAEITHFKQLLAGLVEARIKHYDAQPRRSRRGPLLTQKMSAEKMAAGAVEALYTVAFGSCDQEGVAVPFITSFCSHSGDHQYERDNGLLSQWRGYGGTAKYALVFDTAGLEELRMREYDKHAYTFMHFCDVVYNIEDVECAPDYEKLANEICSLVAAGFKDDNEKGPDLGKRVYMGLMQHCTSFKHRGFREEREVRMILTPTTANNQKMYSDDPQYNETRPLKPILGRGPETRRIPYVQLFDGLGCARNLPIRRIIVGPGSGQDQAVKTAKEIVGGGVHIVRSETPYLDVPRNRFRFPASLRLHYRYGAFRR